MSKLNIISSYNASGSNKAIKEMERLQAAASKAGDKVAEKMAGAAAGAHAISAKTGAVGTALTRNITVPVVAVGGASVKAFADFEDAMTKSTAIMGDLSAETRKKMEDEARKVATTLSVSHKEAADSYYYLASAGLDAEVSMAALPQVAKFAQAGAFDMATATNLAADSMSALGLSSKDPDEYLKNLTRTTDVFARASQLSNASIEQFSTSMTKKAGTALKTYGQDMETGTAALMIFADKGVKGEQAGTMLSATINGLAKNATKNADEFKKMGVSVFDSDGNMRDMNDVIKDLEGSLSGMSDKEKTATLMKLGFNEEALNGLNLLMGSSEAMDTYEGALNDAGGTVDTVANNQMDSMNAQMGLAKDKFIDAGISIGEKLVPHLSDLADKVTAAVDWFRSLDEGTQNNIIRWAGFAAVLGPSLTIFSKVSGGLGTMFGFLGKVRMATKSATAMEKSSLGVKIAASIATKTMAVAQGILNAVMSANPIALVVLAIVALIAIFAVAWATSDKFRAVVTKAWEAVKDAAVKTWDWLKGLPERFTAWVASIQQKFAMLKIAIAMRLAQIKNSLLEWVTGIKDAVVNKFIEIKDAVVGYVKDLADGLARDFSGMIEGVKTIFGGFSDYFAGAWEVIKAIFMGPILLLTSLFTGDFEQMRLDAAMIWTKLTDGIAQMWEGIKGIFGGAVDVVIGFVTGFWTRIKRVWQRVTDFVVNAALAMKDKAIEKWQQMVAWVKGLPNRISTAIGNLGSLLKSKGTAVITGMWNGIKNRWEDAKAWVKGLPGRITKSIGDMGTLLKDAGKSIINGLWNGLKQKWEDVKTWITGIGDWIRENKGPLDYDRKLLVPAGAAIMGGFGASLDAGWQNVAKQLRGYTADIGSLEFTATTPRGSANASQMQQAAPTRSFVQNITIQGKVDTYADGLRAMRDMEMGLTWG